MASTIVTSDVYVDQLRKQRNWVLGQVAGDEREGLTNLLDSMLDMAEGYARIDSSDAVWAVQQTDGVDGLYLFADEEQARDLAACFEEAIVSAQPIQALADGEVVLRDNFVPEDLPGSSDPEGWVGFRIYDRNRPDVTFRVTGCETLRPDRTRLYGAVPSEWIYLANAELALVRELDTDGRRGDRRRKGIDKIALDAGAEEVEIPILERFCTVCERGEDAEKIITTVKDFSEACRDLANGLLEGFVPVAVYDLDRETMIELHISTPVVTRSEDQGIMHNALASGNAEAERAKELLEANGLMGQTVRDVLKHVAPFTVTTIEIKDGRVAVGDADHWQHVDNVVPFTP